MGRLAGKIVCACTGILAWAASFEAALAQVTIDGTANGQAQTLAGPTFNINSNLGRASGTNLFHSFGTFSIPNGNTANFNGAVAGTTIQNIIARVTGGAQSDINGTIRVDGATLPGANLFLVNPAGIMFGPTATLNVPGSFHASTADYIGFANGERFYANPNTAGSSFSVSTPSAFGFLGQGVGRIELDGAQLTGATGKTLSFVAGDIFAHANGATGTEVLSPVGTLNLFTSTGPNEIRLDGALPAALSGTLRISGPTQMRAQGNGGGSIRIITGNFTMSGDGALINAINTGTVDSIGGIKVDANTVAVDGASGFTTSRIGVAAGFEGLPQGIGGDIAINAQSLSLSHGANISTTTLIGQPESRGDAGNIRLNISGALTVDGFAGNGNPSGIYSNTGNNAAIAAKAGNIDIRAGKLVLTNTGTINATTNGGGASGVVTITVGDLYIAGGGNINTTSQSGAVANAGTISVSASGDVTMTGANSFIQSQALGTGNAGNISVSAGTMNILRDAAITTDTSTNAQAGTITVNVAGSLTIDGTGHTNLPDAGVTGITSDAFGAFANTGDAGSVTVNAGSLVLRNAGVISSNTNTAGNAGSVTVNVGGSLLIDGSVHPHFGDFTGIASAANEVLDPAQGGKAGNVTVTAGSLTILTNGQVLADTYTDKDAGTIMVNAGSLVIDGAGQGQTTGILSDTFIGDGKAGQITINAGTGFMTNGGKVATETGAAGHGGDIVANFGTLYLQNGASISGTSTDKGNAGNVTVSSPGTIEMLGTGTTIQSRATDVGEAGTVLVAANQLVMKEGAAVTTEAAVGGGGNITMHLVDLLYMLRSSITTSVAGGSGSGGDIFIDPRFVVLNQSIIQARAFAGNGGNITIIAGRFLQSIDSIIDASSTLGVSGLIATTTPETDVVAGLAQLPTGLGSESKLEQRACVGPDEAPTLSLVPVGRGGLAIVPDASLSQPAFVVAGRGQPARGTAAQPLKVSPQLAQFQALAMDVPSSIRCVH